MADDLQGDRPQHRVAEVVAFGAQHDQRGPVGLVEDHLGGRARGHLGGDLHVGVSLAGQPTGLAEDLATAVLGSLVPGVGEAELGDRDDVHELQRGAAQGGLMGGPPQGTQAATGTVQPDDDGGGHRGSSALEIAA